MSSKGKASSLVPPNISEVFQMDHEDEIKSVRFNRKGDCLAASYKNQINLISIQDQKQINQFKNDSNHEIFDISWNQQGDLLSSISEDNQISFWDIRENKIQNSVQGPKNDNQFSFSIQFNPSDNNTLISTCFDEFVYLWDIRNLKQYQKFKCGFNPITTAKFYNTNIFACGSLDGFIRTFDIQKQQQLRKVCLDEKNEKNRSAICSIFIVNKFLLSSSLDNKIRLWQIDQQKMIKDYVGHKCENYFLECSFLERDYIMGGSQNGEVFVWYLNKHKVVAQKLECFNPSKKIDAENGEGRMVLTIDEARGEKIFATGCADGTLKVWKIQAGQK